MATEILPKLDRFTRVLPILGWLPSYDARWFRADVIAGLTLWGILVPEGIAYAGLAGAAGSGGTLHALGLGDSRKAA
jgi:sulfate permease, SulP family